MYTLYWASRKFMAKPVCFSIAFLVIKGILKALFTFIPWLLNFSDLPNYGSNSRKGYTLRLLPKCLGRSTPSLLGVNLSIPSSSPLDGLLLAQLYTYFLAKSLQNGATFKQKLTPGFKNHMRNLDNFRQAVESPKSWNSMGYIFSNNRFLQLKDYIQRIYLTLLSTTCVKIHQIPYVIFETIIHFSLHNMPVLF